MCMDQMNVKTVINASVKVSIIGVAYNSDEVVVAKRVGGQYFYEMEALYAEAGRAVDTYTQTEAALVTNSASSALALAVAGLVTKNHVYFVDRLHIEPLHKE